MPGADPLPPAGLGGETLALARALDWDSRAFPNPVDWPPALRTAASICLTSRFAMGVLWGPDRAWIYNDAFIPICSHKHPAVFGQSSRDAFAEIWDTVGPMLQSVQDTGRATWSEDLPLFVRRDGVLTEGYFTFSYSPIHDDTGTVAGLYVTVMETTQHVLSQRRLRTISALAITGEAHADLGPEQVGIEIIRALGDNPADIPFAALYLGGHLAACEGCPPEAPTCPPDLDPASPPWPVTGAAALGPGALHVDAGGHDALLLPLAEHGHLLVGTSPALLLDESYADFFATVARRAGAELATADAIASERETARELHREQRILAELFDRAPAAVCLWWGPEHRYRMVSDRYKEIVPLGDDPIGKPIAEALPAIAEIAVPALDHVRNTFTAEEYEDLPLPLGGEGSIDGMRYYTFAITAIPAEDGSPGGVLGLTVETTDTVRSRTELEAELSGERQIAETLQRALLPGSLPDLPGARLSARYQAAGERQQVGGDFYDAFENGDGTWTLIVGDVQGKGPRAAALTAMARYTIRAEAAHGAQPGRLVAMLNDELCRHRQAGAEFCTVVCATVALSASDRSARMRIAVAGHPAPIILRNGRGPHIIEKTGPLVGIMPDATWTDVRVMLTPGDAAVFYTDGLTEARAPDVILEPVDLAAGLADATGRSAEQLVSRLAAELPGADALRDDYAILALSMDP